MEDRLPELITRGREEFDSSTFGMAGFAILFAFLGAQMTATSIYEEKKLGTFRRLQASPLSKAQVLIGKMLPNFVLALVQVAVIFGGEHGPAAGSRTWARRRWAKIRWGWWWSPSWWPCAPPAWGC